MYTCDVSLSTRTIRIYIWLMALLGQRRSSSSIDHTACICHIMGSISDDTVHPRRHLYAILWSHVHSTQILHIILIHLRNPTLLLSEIDRCDDVSTLTRGEERDLISKQVSIFCLVWYLFYSLCIKHETFYNGLSLPIASLENSFLLILFIEGQYGHFIAPSPPPLPPPPPTHPPKRSRFVPSHTTAITMPSSSPTALPESAATARCPKPRNSAPHHL
jgi:hypothetical protein